MTIKIKDISEISRTIKNIHIINNFIYPTSASLLSNHWQEPSHTWNIIALTLYPGCGPEVGIRVQELGYIHFEVLRQSVFLNIHISAINDKNPFILGTLSYQSIDFYFYSILFCFIP